MIRLEKFDRDGYAALISWVDSEETLMQFAGPLYSYPLTPAQLDESLSDPNRTAFSIVYGEAGGSILHAEEHKSIGHAEIYYSESSAKLGRILIGDERQRGKGLGQQIMHLLLDLAFARPGIEMVELNVFDWN